MGDRSVRANNRGPDLLGEPLYSLVEPRCVVTEVDHEAVAPDADVVEKALGDPVRRAADGGTSPLIGALGLWLLREQRAETQYDSAVWPAFTKPHHRLRELCREQRNRVPNTGLASAAERGVGDTGDPDFDTGGADEGRTEPAV